ncbi:tRNA-intron lyase [Candidatus Bathyarchaeota archaeon]|nr:MAG: tRNA-intron lyase [Candidatus Hecatellales archaeon]RLI35490.1 MAG: tRNA-intron lyase [Candidatus Bathyarchaeota archaeon]
MEGKPKFKAQLVEDRLLVSNLEEARSLYRLGYYGKPLGISKPKTPDFAAPLLLDLLEGAYLAEKGVLEVYKNGRKISPARLKRAALKAYRDFKLKYLVYRDLREKGFIVQPGIKFGCDFAVYQQGPGIDHAPYLVEVRKPSDLVGAPELVRSGRLATAVRKRFIIAVPNLKTGEIFYLMFKWWKP